MSEQRDCPLFRLPTELRWQIWEYTVPKGQTIRIGEDANSLCHQICGGPLLASKDGLHAWALDACTKCSGTGLHGPGVEELKQKEFVPPGAALHKGFNAVLRTWWIM